MGQLVQASFTGITSVMVQLSALGKPATANKVTRKGVTQAAKYVYKQMRQVVAKGKGPKPGSLRRSIGQKVKTYRGANTTVAIIGPRTKFLDAYSSGQSVNIKRPSKYAHIVERGRRRRGVVAPRPFVKPTLQRTSTRAGLIAAKGIMVALAKEMKGRRRRR